MLMKGASKMSQAQTSKDTLNAISSPGSAVGRKPFALPGGQQIALFGPDLALANHLVARANGREKRTNGTFGQSSADLSPSAALQWSLENRLRARMAAYGSPEYALTWKHWDMPSGLPICALRASARRISGKDCTGWPTARANDGTGAQECKGRTGGMSLKQAAKLAGWPTARAQDSYERTSWPFIEKMAAGEVQAQMTLSRAARMAGWRTPSASDGEGGSMDVLLAQRNGYSPKLKLRDQAPLAMTHGAIPSGSPAPTERRGVLNPALSLWLMGYPDEWLSCGVRAMQSSRR
jgi:hypothetical protein